LQRYLLWEMTVNFVGVTLVALALLLNSAFFTRHGWWPLRPVESERDRPETDASLPS